MPTNRLSPAEIEKYLRENLYEKATVAWSTKDNKRQITDAAGKQVEFLEPRLDALLLMAKYYELKYGVKIIVAAKGADLDAIKDLVDKCEKSSKPCKFGFILPNLAVKRNGFLREAGWNSSQPFSDLDGKLLCDKGHVCPVIYEKLADGRSSIIVLDSIGMVGDASAGHRPMIQKIAEQSVPVYINNAVLQSSTKGCRDLAILILKDALRIPHLLDELGLKNENYGDRRFDILPEKLLKYLQTGFPWKTADAKAPILRASAQKPLQSLQDYNAQNQGTIHLGNEEVHLGQAIVINDAPLSESVANTKLLRENQLMLARLVKLCEFYEVDSAETIKNLVQTVSKESAEFPVKLPETSNLPEWSRASEWAVAEGPTLENPAFRNASNNDKYIYQSFNFVARNLQSASEPRRDRAQIMLDPFPNQVGRLCQSFMADYFRQRVDGLCAMVSVMDHNPEQQTKFIAAFNAELKTDLTCQDFDVNSKSDKLELVLKSLDFSRENDPLKELIIKCNIPNDYPSSFEQQVKNLCRAAETELTENDLPPRLFQRIFVKQINNDLKEIGGAPEITEGYLQVEDFDDYGSDKLKNALHFLGYDQEDNSVENLLLKYYQQGVLNRYLEFYPFEIYQRLTNASNLIANIDPHIYKKISENPEVTLEESEAVDIVLQMSRNKKMALEDSSPENGKAVRELFRNIARDSSIYGDYHIAGLADLDDWSIQSCLNLAHKTNNHRVTELLHKIIPMEGLLLIPQKEGGLENDEESLHKYLEKDPSNFNKLAHQAVRKNNANMIEKLVSYQEHHDFKYDWNQQPSNKESLPLLHLAASLSNSAAVRALLCVKNIDPSLKVGDPAKNAAEMAGGFMQDYCQNLIMKHLANKNEQVEELPSPSVATTYSQQQSCTTLPRNGR